MPYAPDWWPCCGNGFKPAAMSILEICDELHAANTGSSDPLPDERRRELVKALNWKIDNWNASTGVGQVAETETLIFSMMLSVIAEFPLMEGAKSGD